MGNKKVPAITVIVPIYNASRDVEKCVDALKRQHFVDYEVIIIDDGSSDDSYEKCKRLINDDLRFKIIRQENRGAGGARNRGIEEAQSDFLCFVDVDDFVDEDYLRNFFLQIEQREVDLVMQSYQMVSSKEKKLKKLKDREYHVPNDFDAFFADVEILGFCAPFCKLFRRSVLREMEFFFNTFATCGEDYDFFLRYLACCKVVLCNSAVSYYYKIHSESLSRRRHAFVTEWNSFLVFYETSTNFSQKYNVPHLILQMNNNIAYFIVARLWPSLYGGGLSRLERKTAFYRITEEQVKIVNDFYTSTNVVEKVLLFLWKHRLFGIFDSFMIIIKRVMNR